jgi:sucrose-6F-phosphate phosphohydrolase
MTVRLLLCTDLDRTLLPNGPQPESQGARDIFSRLAAQPGVNLVYVTGRDQGLVEQAMAEYRLPQPDYVIADVGSTIYEIQQGIWRHWSMWEQEIAPDWEGRSHDELHSLFNGFAQLRLQEQAKQNTFKLSYYVPLDADHEALMSEMHSILVRQHIRANLIWSIDELANTGLLDVLPASASKQHAIEYLMEQLGFSLANTVFAGDSGNDLMVLASPIRSVLVANASDDVRDEARQLALNMGQIDALYIAEGGFLQMNGNYSAGILEGIVHYMPEVKELIGDVK